MKSKMRQLLGSSMKMNCTSTQGANRLPVMLMSFFLLGSQAEAAGIDEVNMLYGTSSSAQCPLTAARPFGMISPGPINDPKAPCGFSSKRGFIQGFNHTHLQGTGCTGYGVVTVMPTTGNQGFGSTSAYDVKKVVAQPGFVSMKLESSGIVAEMTATKRAAIHRYVFPESNEARILVDCSIGTLRDKENAVKGHVTQAGPTELAGSVISDVWSKNITYFYLKTSKEFKYTDGGERGGYVSFPTTSGEAVMMKIGISYVSAEQAKKNMDAEIPAWDFEGVRKSAYAEWKAALDVIEIRGGNPDQRAIFYSSLYRTMFHPQLTSDVDGQYRGMDDKIHTASDHGHYSVLSTWDTFRAEHPLLNLIQPRVALDVIKTMLDDYQQSGWTPKWKLANKETSCMPGSWACVIIPDAYATGITGFDTGLAWQALYHDSNFKKGGKGYENVDEYLKQGWINGDIGKGGAWNGTTRTLQNAYCDFALSRFAQALGKSAEASLYKKRAYSGDNLWDDQVKFFRGKGADGKWLHEPFDPTFSHLNGHEEYGDYCEGNAWQYLFHQFHDCKDLIQKLGGDTAFEQKLDECFATGTTDKESIGQYWHGNEPDQHYPYLYNYVGKPSKSADKIRQCLKIFYSNDGWGICGNDDAGQMSAWYVFSALGFYPVTHTTGEYVLGSPLFSSSTLHLKGGDFTITSSDSSDANRYIQRAKLNGSAWDKTFFSFASIKNGGALLLQMGSSANSAWGTAPSARPYSMSSEIR